jgi:hypothetical protein
MIINMFSSDFLGEGEPHAHRRSGGGGPDISPEGFDKLVSDEVELLTRVARAANIKAD